MLVRPHKPAPDPSTIRFTGPWTHRDVSANGIRLHVAELGSGPMVLLLHGFAGFWWVWHQQLRSLAHAGFRAVAMDLRGYGDSDKPPRGYDVWTSAGDVAGLIRALGERKAHLVGHGWGGVLAWSVGVLHPRVVTSMTAMGAAHPLALRSAILRAGFGRCGQARALSHLLTFQVPMAPERKLTANRAAAVEHMLEHGAAPAWRNHPDFTSTADLLRHAMQIPGTAHSALEYYRWAFRSQFRGDGRRFNEMINTPLRLPALHMHGDVDPYVLLHTAQRSAPWLDPRSRFEVLTDVGHFPHLEAAERTGTVLTTFLQEFREH